MNFLENTTLTTEQLFSLRKYEHIAIDCSKEQLIDLLIESCKNNLIKDNIIKNLLKEKFFNEK